MKQHFEGHQCQKVGHQGQKVGHQGQIESWEKGMDASNNFFLFVLLTWKLFSFAFIPFMFSLENV